VQRVLAPTGSESWTVIGDDLRPVEPVERYLAWLSRVERSPNTVRAVNGHRFLPMGGHRDSPLAAIFSPQWRPSKFPTDSGLGRDADRARRARFVARSNPL
jgi:hypothetical protein